MTTKKRAPAQKKQPTLPVLVRYKGKGQPSKPDWHIHDLVAIFPTIAGNYMQHTMQCYSPVGEHATCVDGYVGKYTKPATPEQVNAMLTHLKSRQGYQGVNLRAVSRISRHHRAERVRQLRQAGYRVS